MTCHSFTAPTLIAAAFLLLSACGGDSSAPDSQQTAPAETVAAEPDMSVGETDTAPAEGSDVTEPLPELQVESLETADLEIDDHDHRAGGAAHVHGEAELALVLEGANAQMSFESPLESLLGFEYEPVTEAEQDAMSTLMLALESSTAIATPSAGAACVTLDSEIRIQRDGDHATLLADYLLNCDDTGRMTEVNVGALTSYPGLESVDIVIIGENGQSAGTVTADNTSFAFDF